MASASSIPSNASDACVLLSVMALSPRCPQFSRRGGELGQGWETDGGAGRGFACSPSAPAAAIGTRTGGKGSGGRPRAARDTSAPGSGAERSAPAVGEGRSAGGGRSACGTRDAWAGEDRRALVPKGKDRGHGLGAGGGDKAHRAPGAYYAA
ncbi:hypothetical protein GCM10022284_73220 [Streptomyces hundungensis]